jgi:hypothetical protein
MIWALARWQPPGQQPRTGQVLVTVGTRAGSTVTIWIDRSGAVTSPPPEHCLIVGKVYIAVITICAAASLLLLASNAPAAGRLGRRVAGDRAAVERSPQLRSARTPHLPASRTSPGRRTLRHRS